MTVRIAQLLAAILALALLTACTRPTTVEGAWADGATRNRSFANVLVVGVSPNYNTRCRFERMLRDSLIAEGIRAETSCSKMGLKDALTREAVVRIVTEIGSDAVLSTRLVDGKAALVQGGSDEARGENYYKPTGYGYAYDPYYGAYGVPVVYGTFVAEDPALTLQRTVVVSSNLYETRGAALVYTLDTTARNMESQGEVMDAVAVAIAGRLGREGLIRREP
jgi:hypothetical protein